jgi:predicted nucleic acid-binding protein
VLQELVHRYLASGRWALGREVLESFGELMHDRVEPVYAEDVLQAGMLANDHPGVSARDLVHWAVMQRAGTERIITADTDFDRLPSVVRLDPVDVGEWGTAVIALAGD